MKALAGAVVVLAVICAWAPAARANGLLAQDVEADGGLCALAALEVSVALDEQLAVLHETRRYRLPPPAAGAEASERRLRFLRSLPGAGTRVIELRVDGQVQDGELLAPTAADALRTELTASLGDPAPLRELGSALYVAELVLPAGAAEVEIALGSELPLRAFGSLRGIALPLDWHKQAIAEMQVEVSAASEAPLRVLYSPYHALAVERPDAHTALGSYTGRGVCTELDLVLLSSSGDEPIRLDLLPFRRSPAEEGHFLALLSPPLAADATAIAPRDIAIALDVSGSMSGEKLSAAKQALDAVLAGLRPEDAIALVSFHSKVSRFSDSVQAATDEVRAAARGYVAALAADGGTNIHDALLAALQTLPAGRGRPRYVVLLTDGVPTEGPTAVDEIVAATRAHNEIGARVFSFGIGDDVNTVLLDRLAADSGGGTSYIRPGASITAAVEGFFEQIRDPILTDPELDFGDLAVSDLHPSALPDLFAGQQITVLGRFDFAGSTTLTLRGQQAGRPVEYRFSTSVPAYDLDNAYAARIWALRQVGALLTAIKQGNADPALQQEVADVARRFGVLTEFTRLTSDADGDSELSYVGVPTDAVGALAVDTSTTLSGYTSGGALEATAPSGLRYFADRTLLWRDGFYTDTRLEGEPEFVDLVFGSERYFELARREAPFGAAGLLSVHPSVRFELLGRAFRVSAEAGPYAAPESELPAPAVEPVTGPTEVTWIAAQLPDAPAAPEQDAPLRQYGCQLGGGPAGSGASAVAALLTAITALRMRRRKDDHA